MEIGYIIHLKVAGTKKEVSEMAECARCGRKLKTAKSIEDGMGRVCKRKSMTEKAVAEKRGKEADGNTKAENENRN